MLKSTLRYLDSQSVQPVCAATGVECSSSIPHPAGVRRVVPETEPMTCPTHKNAVSAVPHLLRVAVYKVVRVHKVVRVRQVAPEAEPMA